MQVEGENFPPPALYRHSASLLSVLKLLAIGAVLSGTDPFPFLGVATPGVWHWARGNKVYACLMIFFLSNLVESQLMSTGAFEVFYSDVPVWSKLQSGRPPSLPELMQALDNHIHMATAGGSAPHIP